MKMPWKTIKDKQKRKQTKHKKLHQQCTAVWCKGLSELSCAILDSTLT